MAPTVATLEDYMHFHGMLCRPSTAIRCISSFQYGTVLFMPSRYYKEHPQHVGDDDDDDDEHGDNNKNKVVRRDSSTRMIMEQLRRYDYSQRRQPVGSWWERSLTRLNFLTYYGLVLLSCTGLSSLTGQTICYVAQEEDDDEEEEQVDAEASSKNVVASWSPSRGATRIAKNGQERKSLSSLVFQSQYPPLMVVPAVWDYIFAQSASSSSCCSNNNSSSSGDINNYQRRRLSLKRRFEYHFGGIIPLRVIMLHILEEIEEGTSASSQSILHLVEVYHVENHTLRALLQSIQNLVEWFKCRM